jgi:hypothetical protein
LPASPSLLERLAGRPVRGERVVDLAAELEQAVSAKLE